MSDRIDTVGDALPREIARCRKVLGYYEEIGPAGMFGAAMIRGDIAKAEAAIIEGDLVGMIRALTALKEIKE